MKLIEEIVLSNGLKLEIADLSRTIAADTVKVEVAFQMKMGLEEAFFASAEDYLQVKQYFGDSMTYEHTRERTFVPAPEETAARAELIQTFKENSLQYLAHPQFAKKMALSLLRDIKLNPYRYKGRPDATPEE
ncbi:MAG: hypothetical protein R6W75_03100 [Smithellaceae bacterium]